MTKVNNRKEKRNEENTMCTSRMCDCFGGHYDGAE